MMYGTLCAEFYDVDKKLATADEINFYKSFINKNDLILEPMCGSGRLLIPLLQEGYQVHGVDNSLAMLKNCEQKTSTLQLHPQLYKESIETMSLPNKYNMILIPLGSFQLFYPRKIAFHVLQKLRDHLKIGGKLILDLFVPWEALYQNHEEEFSEKEVKTLNNSIIKHKSHNIVNKYDQYTFCDSVYTKTFQNKVVAEEKEQMYICWYYRYEMELILEKCGFKNITYQTVFFSNENHMIFSAEN